jgi:hypothetical protein
MTLISTFIAVNLNSARANLETEAESETEEKECAVADYEPPECNSTAFFAQHVVEDETTHPPAIKALHLVSIICLIAIFIVVVHQIESNVKLKVENDDGDALQSREGKKQGCGNGHNSHHDCHDCAPTRHAHSGT